ncbi:hypothetical protein BBJ28_00005790 [Nothophytophthora sp. Chile5]|nr:hypothetical protein BBJ28_00005790 [Nothophytophthora sp. Chile5]
MRLGLCVLVALGLLSLALLSSRMPSFSSFRASSLKLRVPKNVSQPASPPTYMLARVIGNALPPRHDPARALQNLRFILEHERLADDGLATHWVLNRLAEPEAARQIRELLTDFGAEFTELPLELEAYARTPFHVVVEDEGLDRVHVEVPKGEDAWTRMMNVNAMYASKNRYALGINGARNAMLDITRHSGARWLLPWDQTCFLTREAWLQIKRDLDEAPPERKYFVSYMDRLTEENDIVLSPDFQATPWEEPQLIFRSDAVERFDEQLRYGQRDKAALLVRLQVSGVWDGWGWSTWEQRRTYANVSRDVSGVDMVPSTGYVLRLYSGLPPNIESNNPAAGMWREMRRAEGVITLLDSLEERVMREVFNYRPDKLLVYDEALLLQYKQQTGNEHTKEMISALLADAENAMQVANPWTVASNGALDPARDARIFANFYDQRLDGNETLDDGQMLRQMAYNTTALALAWRLTDDKRYAVQAGVFLDAWCVNPTTAMRATLEYADMSFQKLLTSEQGFTRGSLSGIRHTAVVPMLLDAVRLLNGTSSKTEATGLPMELQEKVTTWAQELYDKLQSGYALDTFRSSPGLFALQYDLQVAALAAFLNKPIALRFTLGTMQGRLMTMLSREEKLLIPTVIATRPYKLMMLATWGFAADLAQQFGLASHFFRFDLSRNHREERVNEDGGLLCRFVGHSVPCCHVEITDKSSHDPGRQCVTALQRASETQLFIYARLARQAVANCPLLRKRPTCSALAQVQTADNALTASELSRYSLPPYPFLRASA